MIFGRMVPYSGSVGPRIRLLEPGHARVEIPDRRSNRQHLGSVHAIALMNVAEMTSGLAMMAGLPDGVRGIVTNISMQYIKKARGTITAVARVDGADRDHRHRLRRDRPTASTARAPCRARDRDAGGSGPCREVARLMETPFTRHDRRPGPADLRPDVSLLQPRAGRCGQRGGRARRRPADLADLRARPRLPRRACGCIRSLTDKPIGFNALIEASSKLYFERMQQWIDIALEEGVRFFLTSLGNPKWVCERVHAVGGVVYHDVTETEVGAEGRRWRRRRTHRGECRARADTPGRKGPQELFDELAPFGVPVVSAGGVGDAGGVRAPAAHRLRRRAARHALHRDDRVQGAATRTSRRSSTRGRTTSSSPSG